MKGGERPIDPGLDQKVKQVAAVNAYKSAAGGGEKDAAVLMSVESAVQRGRVDS